MCGLVYMCTHVCVSVHIFLFPYVCIYSVLYMYLSECVKECVRVFPSENVLKNPPQGLSDIWLWIDSLYRQVKCPVEPLGAAALHIITSLLRLCLVLR